MGCGSLSTVSQSGSETKNTKRHPTTDQRPHTLKQVQYVCTYNARPAKTCPDMT
jgi:hypothetical protein